MRCSTTELRVAVVGAGIAGLTVAAWLHRLGISCTVHERAGRLAEVGAGVQIGPNATRLLHRLGLAGELAAIGVRPAAVRMRHWRTGETLASTALGAECEEMYGAPYYTLHRADLHRALRRRAGRVRLGRRCVGVRERAGQVEISFADGTTAAADLVVGADGIRSGIRDALASDTPVYSGVTVYRGLAGRVARPDGAPAVTVWVGPGGHCVCYPISHGLVNLVATAPADGDRDEDWTAPGRVEDLVAAYGAWHGEVRRAVSFTGPVTRWALHERPALRRWCTDRVALVGDAAHPMLPFGAQGAAQAIEDATALATCLRGAGPDDVPEALRRYQEVRMPRVARVGEAVGAYRGVLHEGRPAADLRMGLGDQAWLYGYDAERAAATAGAR